MDAIKSGVRMLTKEQALAIIMSILDVCSKRSFVLKLLDMWLATESNPSLCRATQRSIYMETVAPVLVMHGFEDSQQGFNTCTKLLEAHSRDRDVAPGLHLIKQSAIAESHFTFAIENWESFFTLDVVPCPTSLYIAGSWNNFKPEKMHWDGHRFTQRVQIGTKGSESFQLLFEGRWRFTIYPSVPDASPLIEHDIRGPDCHGHGKNWTIRPQQNTLSQGAHSANYSIFAYVNDMGKVTRCAWLEESINLQGFVPLSKVHDVIRSCIVHYTTMRFQKRLRSAVTVLPNKATRIDSDLYVDPKVEAFGPELPNFGFEASRQGLAACNYQMNRSKMAHAIANRAAGKLPAIMYDILSDDLWAMWLQSLKLQAELPFGFVAGPQPFLAERLEPFIAEQWSELPMPSREILQRACSYRAAVRVIGMLSGDLLCTGLVPHSNTILDVKYLIQESTAIPVLEQRLFAGGRLLLDFNSVSVAAESFEQSQVAFGVDHEEAEVNIIEVTLLRLDPAYALVMDKIQQGKLELQSLPDMYRCDKHVVSAAVKVKAKALLSAADDLRYDEGYMLELMQSNGNALCYVPEELRTKRDIVLAAVTSFGAGALEFAPDMQRDREVVLKALHAAGCSALEFAHESLYDDKEFIRGITAYWELGGPCQGLANPLVWRSK